MNITMNEANAARRLRGTVNSSKKRFFPLTISLSASNRTWISRREESAIALRITQVNTHNISPVQLEEVCVSGVQVHCRHRDTFPS